MSRYRCFFLDAADHFRNIMEFMSSSDAEALEKARLYHDAARHLYSGFELWQSSRHLATERAS